MCLLIAGWVTNSTCAALEKLRLAATSINTRCAKEIIVIYCHCEEPAGVGDGATKQSRSCAYDEFATPPFAHSYASGLAMTMLLIKNGYRLKLSFKNEESVINSSPAQN